MTLTSDVSNRPDAVQAPFQVAVDTSDDFSVAQSEPSAPQLSPMVQEPTNQGIFAIPMPQGTGSHPGYPINPTNLPYPQAMSTLPYPSQAMPALPYPPAMSTLPYPEHSSTMLPNALPYPPDVQATHANISNPPSYERAFGQVSTKDQIGFDLYRESSSFHPAAR